MTLTLESPTRVTLALDIIRRLDEGSLRGYHELGIIKHKIALADVICIESLSNSDDGDIVVCDDPRVPCDGTNICIKAAQIIRKKYKRGNVNNISNINDNNNTDNINNNADNGRFGNIRISITKNIPVMGGLAGGSANAAAMLKGLDELWDLRLTQGEFCDLGRQLGMDVPYFFSTNTAFDSEATGIIKPINTTVKLHIILAIPEFGVSTKEAYGGIDYSRIGKDISSTNKTIAALERNDLNESIKHMHNDFEKSILDKHERLRNIRDQLLNEGCLASIMTGSGSTIIGIAPNKPSAEKISARIDSRTIVTESLS